jgi:hypothetical protein
VLPATLSFKSSEGDGWICAAQGSEVTCVFDTELAAGESTSFKLRTAVDAPSGSSIRNTAVASVSNKETTLDNNESTAEYSVPQVGGEVAFTGASSLRLAVVSLLLVVAGGLFLASRRRA